MLCSRKLLAVLIPSGLTWCIYFLGAPLVLVITFGSPILPLSCSFCSFFHSIYLVLFTLLSSSPLVHFVLLPILSTCPFCPICPLVRSVHLSIVSNLFIFCPQVDRLDKWTKRTSRQNGQLDRTDKFLSFFLSLFLSFFIYFSVHFQK